MEVANLLKIEYRGKRVLTTSQIAEGYGCTVHNIRWNYQKNPDKFVEGVHYFKLEGEDLKAFKYYVSEVAKQNSRVGEAENFRSPQLPFSKMASSLILWTKEGAIRHCKMLNTEKAWEMFGILEKAYFGTLNNAPGTETPKIEPPKTESAGVYAFAMEDGTVKIGMSGNIAERIKSVERETQLKVIGVFSLKVESRKKAFEIESALHKYFSGQCVQGEYFLVDFNEICEQIKNLVEYPINRQFKNPAESVIELLRNSLAITDTALRDRDINAAINILNEGLRILNEI